MAQRRSPIRRETPGRYQVRCRPEYANWGLYDTLDGHLVVSGGEQTIKDAAARWNADDPYRGRLAPHRPQMPEGPPREEWP